MQQTLPTEKNTQQSSVSAPLAGIAIAGQAVLLASALLLPAVSEYRLRNDTISELVLGRFGWVQTVAFVASGIGVLALTVALWRLTVAKAGSRIGCVLVGVYGLGALLSAVFPTDPVTGPPDLTAMSTVGLIHVTVFLVSFVSVLVAMYLLTRVFRSDPRWHPIWPLSLLLAIISTVSFFLPSGGLTQRLLVGLVAAWIVLVASRLPAVARRSASGSEVVRPQSR